MTWYFEPTPKRKPKTGAGKKSAGKSASPGGKASPRPKRKHQAGSPVVTFDLFDDPTKMINLYAGGEWEMVCPHIVREVLPMDCWRGERGATFPEIVFVPVKRSGLLVDNWFGKKWRRFPLKPGVYRTQYFIGYCVATGYFVIPEGVGRPFTFTEYNMTAAVLWNCTQKEIEEWKRRKYEAGEDKTIPRKPRPRGTRGKNGDSGKGSPDGA